MGIWLLFSLSSNVVSTQMKKKKLVAGSINARNVIDNMYMF